MKQIKSLLIIALATILLAGCGNKTAKVSDGNQVLVKVGDQVVTKQDLYERLTEYDEGASVASLIDERIVNAEITDTEDVENTVDTTMDGYRADGSLESLMSYYGYDDEDDFRNYLINTEKASRLYDKYIEENWDALVEEYYPVKYKMIKVNFTDDTKEEAGTKIDNAINEIKAGAKFEEVAAKYSADTSLANEAFYVQDTIADANVRAFVVGQTSNLSSRITSSDGASYYLVQITNTNATQLKDEFVGYLKANSDFGDTVTKHYAQKHNVEFFDLTIYKYVKSNYPNYLAN